MTRRMPRSNSAELITLRVNIVKELRSKWKRERERNPYINEHFGGFVNELLHEILEKDEFLRHYAPFLSEEGCTRDRKSTRLNSSHGYISYAVFCLKKKK